MSTARIPDKQFFKIGEVAEIAGVEAYFLRFWESEFRGIKPEKTRTNQRMYSRRDVETVLDIRRLLYDEGYKIEGARRKLKELAGEELPLSLMQLAQAVREELDELDQILDQDER